MVVMQILIIAAAYILIACPILGRAFDDKGNYTFAEKVSTGLVMTVAVVVAILLTAGCAYFLGWTLGGLVWLS